MKNLKLKVQIYSLLFYFGVSSMCFSQSISDSQINKLTAEIIKTIDENYIIPEMKEKLVSQLETNLKQGKYTGIKSQSEYAKVITKDLQDISGDYHLYLLEDKEDNKENPQPQRQMIRSQPNPDAFKNLVNFEMLTGNVAYIEIPMFGPLEYAKEDFDKALNEASEADAIIFDVSKCRGGSGETIAYAIGSFIETPTHLTTYYSKEGPLKLISHKTKFGKLNNAKDIFIVSDEPNGSAGEGFAFYPQQLGRAKVIGQVSRGAGMSNEIIKLSDNFLLSISIRTSVTPNGKQFQGIGVVPDIFAPASYAKEQAHTEAIVALMKKYPKKQNQYKEVLKQISNSVGTSRNVDKQTKKSIEKTVLGYIENFFESKEEEMFNHLHPELAKRGVSKVRGEDKLFFESMSNSQLKELLKKKPVLSVSNQKNKVEILDVFANTASVKLTTGYPGKMEWIEYIHLCKIDEEWKIINITWDYFPRKMRKNRKGKQ